MRRRMGVHRSPSEYRQQWAGTTRSCATSFEERPRSGGGNSRLRLPTVVQSTSARPSTTIACLLASTLWRGQLAVATADGVPINFSSAFYNDGVTQHIEAATICNGGACGEFATERRSEE